MIVKIANAISINIQIIFAFMIPPIKRENMFNTFSTFILVLFLVMNFNELSP